MVRSALSANRTLAVLDWIVGHPKGSFTLSELSRGLDINVPSLMAVLQSLVDAGYLTRSPSRKAYSAGPALLALGLSVGSHNNTVHMLNQELQLLAEAVGTECAASVAIGDKTMVVADAGRPNSQSPQMRIGVRSPLIAPVGHVYMAWNEPAQIEAWIDRAESGDYKIDRARIYDELAVIRETGYSIFYHANAGYQAADAQEALAREPGNPERLEAVRVAARTFADREFIRPEPDGRYNVSNVAAPVFDPNGKVLFVVVINGFTLIKGDELIGHVERLVQTARMLTKHGDGRSPDPRHG